MDEKEFPQAMASFYLQVAATLLQLPAPISDSDRTTLLQAAEATNIVIQRLAKTVVVVPPEGLTEIASPSADLMEALKVLGYTGREAKEMAAKVNGNVPLEEQVRQALKV